MMEAYLLLGLFFLLNVLDGFTTWLGIYGLPVELRATEANVLFKDVEKTFWPAMWRKGFLVILFTMGLYYLANLTGTNLRHAFYVMDVVLLIVVLNNFSVYSLRRLTHRRVRSPIGHLSDTFQRWGLSPRLSRYVAFYISITIITAIVYTLVGVFI